MESEAARCQAISLERWRLYVGSMRRINPGPWQTSIGPAPMRGRAIGDTPGQREPEQDKAPPRTRQRPDQEHKKSPRVRATCRDSGESGKATLSWFVGRAVPLSNEIGRHTLVRRRARAPHPSSSTYHPASCREPASMRPVQSMRLYRARDSSAKPARAPIHAEQRLEQVGVVHDLR